MVSSSRFLCFRRYLEHSFLDSPCLIPYHSTKGSGWERQGEGKENLSEISLKIENDKLRLLEFSPSTFGSQKHVNSLISCLLFSFCYLIWYKREIGIVFLVWNYSQPSVPVGFKFKISTKDWKYSGKKIPENFKKQNLNLPCACNYWCSFYTELGISNLEIFKLYGRTCTVYIKILHHFV